MSQDNDLSAYEKFRLANIRRNAEFLLSMGVQPLAPKQITSIARSKSLPAAKGEGSSGSLKRSRTQRLSLAEEHSTRRSKRRLSLSPDGFKIEDEDDSDNQDASELKAVASQTYQDMPMESFDLDDSEFQVFISLRAWRLRRCRELDVEPYKIFQNRSIAEIIRRRRNDASWANDKEDGERMAKDLLRCWGIGPAKATSGSFGWEIMDVINEDADLLALFNASRKHGDNFPPPPNSQ